MRIADDSGESKMLPSKCPLIVEKAKMLHAVMYPDEHEDSIKASPLGGFTGLSKGLE